MGERPRDEGGTEVFLAPAFEARLLGPGDGSAGNVSKRRITKHTGIPNREVEPYHQIPTTAHPFRTNHDGYQNVPSTLRLTHNRGLWCPVKDNRHPWETAEVLPQVEGFRRFKGVPEEHPAGARLPQNTSWTFDASRGLRRDTPPEHAIRPIHNRSPRLYEQALT